MIPTLDILTGPLASAEAAVFILFAAGVTAMTAFAFVLWVGWVCIKGILVLVLKLGIWPGAKRREVTSHKRHACPDPVCRAVNPEHATYCRHCGRMLSSRFHRSPEVAGA